MQKVTKELTKVMGFALIVGCHGAWASDHTAETHSKPAMTQGVATPNADNTEMNVRDKNGGTATPQKQSNLAQDRELLAAVRHAVVGDKTLSISAHNVKLVVADGVVTLRGPVNSAVEKGKVEKLAQNVAGVSSVDNQLDVKTK